MREQEDVMIPAGQPRRPILYLLLVLLALGGGLLAHLWQTRQAVRLVFPLPLDAPGYTLKDTEGTDIRVIPLAGARLRSAAAPDHGMKSRPYATRYDPTPP